MTTDLPLALVTGASRGIGKAVAHQLAPTHRLLLGGRDASALETLAKELPGAKPWLVDLTDPTSLERAVADIQSLDVLVHSAGVAKLGRVEEATAQAWRDNFEVNTLAVVELTRLLLPALRTARGHVVVINSGAGRNARPGWSPYAASKFAVRAFADALRKEEPELRVTSVYPGRTDTDMQQEIFKGEGRDYDTSHLLKADSVATAVVTAVSATPDAHQTEVILRPR
ncbi:NADP-dependent 3-hydroxy acid dehydrogenase YdfG [Amycolatopsis pretoriensis]|uniref:NADP-dependent 3-hydroxy acid dehydrogenase YdfG n=1 Tax=Amycolatopsis pretoriensis TaxID=218821 RepID=A0A1H5QQB2_9PSEU|nr:SDR family oxidoreductase [Amycolatopsis pretoriensis]SEF28255.1 NADP-dependent 3-hydroxy acid dehydrogenase YdfG [Amycolatopsis pretoriensis]